MKKVLNMAFVLIVTICCITIPVFAVGDYSGKKVEIAFVVDTTGSMSGYIANVKRSIREFATYLEQQGAILRMSVVEYRDIEEDGEQSTIVHTINHSPWHTSVEQLVDTISNLEADGGGDTPESLIDALGCLVNSNGDEEHTMRWSSDAHKFAFVLTDADYKTGNRFGYANMNQMITVLNSNGISTSVITSSSYYSVYSDLVNETGGKLANISSSDYVNELKQLADASINNEARPRKLEIIVTAVDKDSNEKVYVEGATVSLFYDTMVRYFTTDKNGLATVTFDGMSDDQINRATISAHKSWESEVDTSENRRYPLQSLIRNSEGIPQRYIYELHSERIDSNGNWCGTKVGEILKKGNTELVLSEPRLLVNMSICYYEEAGTTEDTSNNNAQAVREFINNYSKQLAQSTDGHIMINKALIGKTNDRRDFYVPSMISADGDRVPHFDSAKLASMADIRIETGNGEATSVHSNAHVGGYFSNDTADQIDTEYIEKHFKNTSASDMQNILWRFSFRRIQEAWNPNEAGADWNLNNRLYVTTTHESGHYLMSFYDEYLNGYDTKWTSGLWKGWFGNDTPRPDDAPKNFGLMDNSYTEAELSNVNDYNYLNSVGHGTKSNDTMQSYVWDLSCEDMLAKLLTKGTKQYTSVFILEWYNEIYHTNYSTKEEVLQDIYDRESEECTWDEFTTNVDITFIPYRAKYTKTSGGEKRRADYSYAALSDSDFITYNGSAIGTSHNTLYNADTYAENAVLFTDGSAFSETIAVGTSGYFYNSLDNSIEAYFIPDKECEFTFGESTESIINEDYLSVNTSVEISTSLPVTVKGELYSVAPINSDIDYTSISWFMYDGGSWKKLSTDLNSEENMNIGARCDYYGEGIYVLMAKPAPSEHQEKITNIRYENVSGREGVISITFTDPNFKAVYEAPSDTIYYNVYVSKEPFTDVNEDGVVVQTFYAGQEPYTIDFKESNIDGYIAVVAVAANGAKSEISDVVAVNIGETDRDGDGIPDWYCDKYLLWPFTGEEKDIANSDDDGDGLTNLQEYLNGSDPSDVNDPERKENIPVSSVEVGKDKIQLNIGENYSLSAKLNPEDASNRNVQWYVDDSSVATIDPDGLNCTVKGVGEGNTNITVVTEDGGYTASVEIVVSTSGNPNEDHAKEFVNCLYRKLLGREPDVEGLQSWTDYLVSRKTTLAKVIYKFVYSKEFQTNPLSKSAFVSAMYETILGREPDKTSLDAWVKILENGCTRKKVLAGFLNSEEVRTFCSSIGIEAGSYYSDEIVDKNTKVTYFVSRMYRCCLGREADYGGLTSWVSALLDGRATGTKIAEGFFASTEMKNMGLSNQDYVTNAYVALLERQPDTNGLKAWTDALDKGADRMKIVKGFVGSQEFGNLCAEYGIAR